MYRSRISFATIPGGRILISDEEGINNIPNNYQHFLSRFDPNSINAINRYLAWGNIDKQLALKAGIMKKKIQIVGNARLDLLNDQGKRFYSRKTKAIKEIFGDFYLINDNFGVEKITENIEIMNDEKSTIEEESIRVIIPVIPYNQ